MFWVSCLQEIVPGVGDNMAKRVCHALSERGVSSPDSNCGQLRPLGGWCSRMCSQGGESDIFDIFG